MHFIGLMPHAQQMYRKALEFGDDDVSKCAGFNLAQILRGSGVSTGNRIRGIENTGVPEVHQGTEVEIRKRNKSAFVADSRRERTNAVWSAHDILMRNVI